MDTVYGVSALLLTSGTVTAIILWARRARNDTAEMLASAADAVAAVGPFWREELDRLTTLEGQHAELLRLYAARLEYLEDISAILHGWFTDNGHDPPVRINGPPSPGR